MGVRCFWLEPTDRVARALRRYSDHQKLPPCTVGSYHNAKTPIEEGPARRNEKGYLTEELDPAPPHDDPRWPVACACGYAFANTDSWQLFTNLLYRRSDTSALVTLVDAPAGAMWDAWWYRWHEGAFGFWAPVDGINLVVKTPGGDWYVDGRCSNCTMPEDDTHRCWVRHGTPPNVTVDKNGKTCAAGAGSIQVGAYHGFLQNGELT